MAEAPAGSLPRRKKTLSILRGADPCVLSREHSSVCGVYLAASSAFGGGTHSSTSQWPWLRIPCVPPAASPQLRATFSFTKAASALPWYVVITHVAANPALRSVSYTCPRYRCHPWSSGRAPHRWCLCDHLGLPLYSFHKLFLEVLLFSLLASSAQRLGLNLCCFLARTELCS